MQDTAFRLLDETSPRRGAAVLVEILRSEGVRTIFGNPGTTEMPLIDALADAPDLRYVLGLQEASVVAMADGYAKASGQPGFVNLHTAGGLGNAMGALISAQVANTPLVVTAGQQDLRHSVTDPLLSGNLVAIAGPVTKWAHEVTDPDHLAVLVRRAFHDCAAAPSGRVFLSLPVDVMERTTSAGSSRMSRIERAAIAGSLDQLGDALACVPPGRLALVAGDEIFTSGVSDHVALAEALGAPVFGSSWPGHMPFPTAHRLWNGNLPSKAAEIRTMLEPMDAVFLIGSHSIIAYLYSDGPALPVACKVLQLSSNVSDLGRSYQTDLSCVGDIRTSLQALRRTLGRKLRPHRDAITKLRREADRARATRHADLRARAAAEFEAVVTTPFAAAAEIVRAIPSHIAIVDEAPATTASVRSWLNSSSTRQYFGMRAAILGWGMPAAIGVSLGLGREPVVCLVGDGSSLYSPQALWTAARERLPVTFVVINNREYNILKKTMRGGSHSSGIGPNRFIGMEIIEPAIDFLALASSMGVPARRIERIAEIAGAVEDGIASGRPNLIDLPISPC